MLPFDAPLAEDFAAPLVAPFEDALEALFIVPLEAILDEAFAAPLVAPLEDAFVAVFAEDFAALFVLRWLLRVCRHQVSGESAVAAGTLRGR